MSGKRTPAQNSARRTPGGRFPDKKQVAGRHTADWG